MLGIIYLFVAYHIYLTRKVMLLAKYFIYYKATGVKLLYGLLMNIPEDESE